MAIYKVEWKPGQRPKDAALATKVFDSVGDFLREHDDIFGHYHSIIIQSTPHESVSDDRNLHITIYCYLDSKDKTTPAKKDHYAHISCNADGARNYLEDVVLDAAGNKVWAPKKKFY